jgi:hypothetical protein
VKRTIVSACAALIAACACSTPAPATSICPTPAADKPAVQLYSGLGPVHHRVATSSTAAQQYFDQGLAFDYAFNHDEAEKSFCKAAALDPKLAMAYWGIALVLGPNYNLPGDTERGKRAFAATSRARSLETDASPVERDLIEALARRCGSDGADSPARAKAYADAMRTVAHRYPDDPDVQALSPKR